MVIFAKNVNQALGSTCTYKYLQVLKNVWEEVPVLSEYLERSDRFDVSAGRFSFRARISRPDWNHISPTGEIIRLAVSKKSSSRRAGVSGAGKFLWVGFSGRNFHRRVRRSSSSQHLTSGRLATAPEHKNLIHYSGSIRAFVDLVCVIGLHQASLPCIIFLCW
jgi:hypothetical protein